MTVPLFHTYVLSRYESLRATSEARLLTLDEMRENLIREVGPGSADA